jgi:hypothetical protein
MRGFSLLPPALAASVRAETTLPSPDGLGVNPEDFRTGGLEKSAINRDSLPGSRQDR